MKVLRFESVGGASGDMILGALLDLGVEAAALERDLKQLHAGDFLLRVESVVRDGLRGTLCRVEMPPQPHHHHHDHGPGPEHGHAHAPHRGLREIECLIGDSRLPEAVKVDSLRVFRRIGEVEARLHGTTVEQIHFHEIGAVDSIVDIVGCCLARHRLGVEGVSVGPLPQGVGTLSCAHGVFPNPAPATVELLRGMPVLQTEEPFELVTPTGAGLLADWAQQGQVPAQGQVLAAGYGFGQRTLSHRPNVIRAVLLQTEANPAATRAHVLECNLDDTSPELIGALSERLLAAGALDVFTTAVLMKKQRPGIVLTVLAEPAHRAVLLDLIFRESTTFGVRDYEVDRTILARRHLEVETPYGRVRIKVGTWRGQDVTWAPEFEDCRTRARACGCAVREVYERAVQAAQTLRSSP